MNRSILFKLISVIVVIVMGLCMQVFAQEYDSSAIYPKDNRDKIENYFKNHYIGKTTITILIDQPMPGTRYIINDKDYFNAGHSFVRLQYYEQDENNKEIKRVIYRGFYPTNRLSMEQIIERGDVNGKINTEEDPVEPEYDHVWNIAKVFEITPEGAKNAVEYIDNFNKGDKIFNVVAYNCTEFTVTVLKKAGVGNIISKHKIQFTLAQRLYAWRKGYDINNIYSYCPGDAGEDIRLSDSFLTLTGKGVTENYRIKILPAMIVDYKYFIKEASVLKRTVRIGLSKYMRKNNLVIKPGEYLVNQSTTFKEAMRIFMFEKKN